MSFNLEEHVCKQRQIYVVYTRIVYRPIYCIRHLPCLTLSSLTLHCHPLQAANCCRISRLVVEEDDLMWFKNQRKLPCIGKPVLWEFSFVGKVSLFPGM